MFTRQSFVCCQLKNNRLLDLSQTTATAEELGDIIARLTGKGATSIKDVIILKK